MNDSLKSINEDKQHKRTMIDDFLMLMEKKKHIIMTKVLKKMRRENNNNNIKKKVVKRITLKSFIKNTYDIYIYNDNFLSQSLLKI